MRRPVLALLPLLVVALLAPVAFGQDAGRIELPEGEPWVHEASSFVFPPDVGTFTRVDASRFDEPGRNVSVGYVDRGLRVMASVYVYPNPGLPLAGHFEQVKRDVLDIHPQARLLSEGQWTLEQGDRKFTGRRAAFAFRLAAADKEQEVVSEAYLLRLGEFFIKFRITCPKARYEPAAERIERFLKSLKLPGSAPAPAPAKNAE